MPSMNTVPNGPAESPEAVPAPSPTPKTKTNTSPTPAAAGTKGRGLRRWRRIRRRQDRPRERCAAAGGGRRDEDEAEDSALLHKRRLPLAAGAPPRTKHEAETSTAYVPPQPSLGPRLAFSVGAGGADSDHSEDRRSGSRSTTASAPRPRCRRHASSVLSPRERDRPPRVGHSSAAAADDSRSRSSVESDFRSSNAVKARHLGAAGLNSPNGVRNKVFSDCCCDHSDEEVRSTGCCRGNGSTDTVVGGPVRLSAGEESAGKGDNGRMHSCADPWSQPILVLQRAQEVLENEVGKIMAIGEEPRDEFDAHGDDEWSGSAHLEEMEPSIEEARETMTHLESRLEEASALVKEKVSRIYMLEAIPGQMQPGKTTIENAYLLLSQSELDQLYQEMMESEIQCIILTRAHQASTTLAEDQMALYEAQKSLSEDYKMLGLKLRHTESRAMVLEEMAEKLQLQCKELSNSSEVLQLRYKASRVSLFCFVQFILLCMAIGTYLMRLSPSPTEVVPT